MTGLTEAQLKSDRGADVVGFRFDQPFTIGGTERTLADYDMALFFAVKVSNGDSTLAAEAQAVAQFMENGGGFFATGDHENLGGELCSQIPRVRSMRRWYYEGDEINDSPPGPHGELPAPCAIGRHRHDTTRAGLDTVTNFEDQSDEVPQEIHPTLYAAGLTTKGGYPAHRYLPHPLLCSPDGVVSYLPDHMHEGTCEVPDDLGRTFTLGGVGVREYPVVDEDPVAHTRRVPRPGHLEGHGLSCRRATSRPARRSGSAGRCARAGPRRATSRAHRRPAPDPNPRHRKIKSSSFPRIIPSRPPSPRLGHDPGGGENDAAHPPIPDPIRPPRRARGPRGSGGRAGSSSAAVARDPELARAERDDDVLGGGGVVSDVGDRVVLEGLGVPALDVRPGLAAVGALVEREAEPAATGGRRRVLRAGAAPARSVSGRSGLTSMARRWRYVLQPAAAVLPGLAGVAADPAAVGGRREDAPRPLAGGPDRVDLVGEAGARLPRAAVVLAPPEARAADGGVPGGRLPAPIARARMAGRGRCPATGGPSAWSSRPVARPPARGRGRRRQGRRSPARSPTFRPASRAGRPGSELGLGIGAEQSAVEPQRPGRQHDRGRHPQTATACGRPVPSGNGISLQSSPLLSLSQTRPPASSTAASMPAPGAAERDDRRGPAGCGRSARGPRDTSGRSPRRFRYGSSSRDPSMRPEPIPIARPPGTPLGPAPVPKASIA